MTHDADKAKPEDRLTHLLKKAKPAPAPEQAANTRMAAHRSRTSPLTLALLTVLLLFSVAQVEPPPPGINGPIAAITVNPAPAMQTADMTGNPTPLAVIKAPPGFHCYAGCSFLKATQAGISTPLAIDSQNI